MVRIIKVVLPIDKPDFTLKLCKKISLKHTALDTDSPLIGFLDMAEFESKRLDALQKQTDGDTRRGDSQALHGQAKRLCGISQGQKKQSEKTLYWHVLQIRDVLKNKNRGQEENLTQWGFDVVVSQTGARRNVRIDIPDDTVEALSELASKILQKHTDLDAASPLLGTGLDLADFETKTTDAAALALAWKEADEDAQAFHGQALHVMGYAEGQTSETVDTLYYDLITIRDRLLQANQNEEENLSQWGFEVVVTGHRAGAVAGSGGGGGGSTGGAVLLILVADINAGNVWNINTSDIEIAPADIFKAEVSGSNFSLYAAPTAIAFPGPGAQIAITSLTPLQTTVGDLSTNLGSSDLMPFVNAFNTGATPGHIKITISE
jgi:hypothetical protein